jgi:hypothetical protein
VTTLGVEHGAIPRPIFAQPDGTGSLLATLQQQNRTTIAGEYKAIVELTASMRKQLSEEPNELLVLPEADIKERIRGVDGGSVAYTTSILERPHVIEREGQGVVQTRGVVAV